MKKKLTALVAVTCLVVLQGCPRTFDPQFDVSSADEIKIGKTKKDDVVKKLGASTNQQIVGDTTIWRYDNHGTFNHPYVSVATGQDRVSENLTIVFKDKIVIDCIIQKTVMPAPSFTTPKPQQTTARKCGEKTE